MKKSSIKVGSKSFFYRIWLFICCLIIIATVTSGFLVYIQVTRQLKINMEQRLLWEAQFYSRQLEDAFDQVALKLDSLVRSEAAVTANRYLLQKEMHSIQISSPSVIRIWAGYPGGVVVPSPITRSDYVKSLPWWRDYLAGKTSETSMGYLMERSQSLIGKPFIDPDSQITALVPLLSIGLNNDHIIRAVGAQVELNDLILDTASINNIDWNKQPVSIYTLNGVLVASPSRRLHLKPGQTNQPALHPLIKQMLQQPNEIKGFKIYTINHQKLAGVFLKIPSLGMVLTVEYPAAEVVDPIRRIAFGPLLVVILLLVVASLMMATLYANTKKIRKVEQLARFSELRALQACINPHFLFNTLNCMVSLAVSTGNQELIKIIRSLIHIFRYGIRNISESVSLQEELEYLTEYVQIQQARYGNRFTFRLNVPEHLLQIKIFKFCIQPIVENCFIHGVDKSLDPVIIEVTAIQSGDDLNITVFNNGPAVSEERYQELCQKLLPQTDESINQESGLGLTTIHYRLYYAFGTPYGISLESSSKGFTVHIKFPISNQPI